MLIKNLFGSKNTFLYNLCHRMVFFLWDFPANITLPPTPVLTFIVTPSSHSVRPSRLLFSSHVRTSRTSIPPYTHRQVFTIYGIRMPLWHLKLTCIHGNSIAKFIPRNQDRNNLHIYVFGKIFVGKEGHWLRPITHLLRFTTPPTRISGVVQPLQIALVHY